MKKNKVFKRLITFMLVISFLISGNTSMVYAIEDESAQIDTEVLASDMTENEEPEVEVETEIVEPDSEMSEISTDDSTDVNVESVSEVPTTGVFNATFFDYTRDRINAANLDRVLARINLLSDEEKSELSYKKIRKDYPTLFFTTAGSTGGDVIGQYSYVNTRGAEVTKNLKPAHFLPEAGAENDYCAFNKNNSGLDINSFTSYKGIVDNSLTSTDSNGVPVMIMDSVNLFDINNSDELYDAVYPNQSVVLNYDAATGYYSLDSCHNKYVRDEATNTVNITQSDYNKTGQGFGFLPLGNKNYHFGMAMDVNFFMTQDGTYNNEPCVFEFSGDDDVWVFIDGKLVLDLGGIHGRCAGKIDFASKTVTYKTQTYDGDEFRTDEIVDLVSLLGNDINNNNDHIMKIFYLERGARESNCEIKFNMPTKPENPEIFGDFSFNKIDANTRAALAGATFKLTGNNIEQEVTSDDNGVVTFTHLNAGDYTIEEIGVPQGYRTSTLLKYYLMVRGNDSDSLIFTLRDENGNEIVPVDNIIYIENIPIDEEYSQSKSTKLVDWQNRIYVINLSVDAYLPLEEINDVNGGQVEKKYHKGKVVDVIDARFELYLRENQTIEELKNSLGAESIERKADGTTEVTWLVDRFENWNVSFEIRAKDSYLGGNSVDTNGPDSRVIIYDDNDDIDREVPFEQPKVNVRIDLKAGEARDEIFLGQSLEKYFTDGQLDKLFNCSRDVLYFADVKPDSLQFSWKDDSGNETQGTSNINEFAEYVRSLSPTEGSDTVPYKELYVTLAPSIADVEQAAQDAAASMQPEGDSVLYTACMADASDIEVDAVHATGKYYVTIIDGRITVDKTYDNNFLTDLIYSVTDKEKIDAKQTAIFTVYRYAEDADVTDIKCGFVEPIESFNITITETGAQTITGLKAGMYRVVENNAWTWKYIAGISEDNSLMEADNDASDGIFYLGKRPATSENGEIVNDTYETICEENVSFLNKLNRELSKIYSDTTNALNQFLGN